MIADKPLGFLLQVLRLQSGTRIHGQNWKNWPGIRQRLACIFKVFAQDFLYFVYLYPLDAFLYSRSRDFEDSEGSALGKAMSSDPWYKDIVPNV